MATSILAVFDQIYCFSGKSHQLQEIQQKVPIQFCSFESIPKSLTLLIFWKNVILKSLRDLTGVNFLYVQL